ncbi:peptidoglycan recognition protein family protein [Corynebacterium pyruviciproducens]|uniref:peptidoglycan recognition protein family protein n=1 Tax=Corynebacterium pyruviciproducens TaxID=598660 RepID=UPI0023F04163|nr:N-acetylmuramoyl-L-alanine amidase [Corynebacterium pyruviciproducens]
MPNQFQAEVTQLTTCDSGRRDPARCQVIVIHTYECPRGDDVEGRAAWQQQSQTGSYNVLIGTRRRLRANDDWYIPWAAMATGNRIGLHACFLAYAAATRAEWLEYDHQLTLGAEVVADWCNRYKIPPVKLTAAEVKAGKRGVCGHGEISGAFHESDHTDPGRGFPWDVFLAKVRQIMAGVTPQPAPQPNREKGLSMQAERTLGLIMDQLAGPGRTPDGDPAFNGWDEKSILAAAHTREGGGKTLIELVALTREDVARQDEKLTRLADAVDRLATALTVKEDTHV